MPGAPVWRNCTCCDWWRPARTWRRISSPSPRPSSKSTPPKSRARNKPRAPRTEPPSPVPHSTLFHFRDRAHQSQVAAILRRLPPVEGAPIAIERARGLSSRGQAVHAGSLLRERRIVFDCTRAEFPRIFVHELFHFVWLRAGNPARFGWEALLGCELEAGAGGELGWSRRWRKQALAAPDRESRSRFWHEYCCESFCDTAAWLYSGGPRHPEFTLAARFRAARRAWFHQTFANRRLPL